MNYLVSDTKLIDSYIKENRTDKDSEKPYYVMEETDGMAVLPNDKLIVEAIKATQTPYTLVFEIDGRTMQIDSADLLDD